MGQRYVMLKPLPLQSNSLSKLVKLVYIVRVQVRRVSPAPSGVRQARCCLVNVYHVSPPLRLWWAGVEPASPTLAQLIASDRSGSGNPAFPTRRHHVLFAQVGHCCQQCHEHRAREHNEHTPASVPGLPSRFADHRPVFRDMRSKIQAITASKSVSSVMLRNMAMLLS